MKNYWLRFQIVFNFRDAKLHFGLEDFMNVTLTVVNNAVNLAMCIINASTKSIVDSDGAFQGVRDLKTVVCGRKYVAEILKLPFYITVLVKLLLPKLHNEL